MDQTVASSPNSLLITIVLGTLAIGLPIFFILAFRFLWERSLNLGRSKELEKLIWQLHRIASAMEHQMNLAYPAVQPGTEEARDIAYLQQIANPPNATAPASRAATATAQVARPSVAAQPVAAPQAKVQQPAPVQQPAAGTTVAPTAPAAEEAENPGLVLRDPSVEAPRAGVNSMFGL
jgi:cytoskeletal protein RodZ